MRNWSSNVETLTNATFSRQKMKSARERETSCGLFGWRSFHKILTWLFNNFSGQTSCKFLPARKFTCSSMASSVLSMWDNVIFHHRQKLGNMSKDTLESTSDNISLFPASRECSTLTSPPCCPLSRRSLGSSQKKRWAATWKIFDKISGVPDNKCSGVPDKNVQAYLIKMFRRTW